MPRSSELIRRAPNSPQLPNAGAASSTERPRQRQAERNCAKPEANSPSNFEEKFPIHDASSARESAVTAWHGIGGLGIIQNESGYEYPQEI